MHLRDEKAGDGIRPRVCRWRYDSRRNDSMAKAKRKTRRRKKPSSARYKTPDWLHQPNEQGEVDSQQRESRLISLSDLQTEVCQAIEAGMTLDQDVYAESGELLLAAGSRITRRFLELLSKRKLTRLHLRPPPGIDYATVDESEKQDDIEFEYSYENADKQIAPCKPFETPLSKELDERLGAELRKQVTFRPIHAWRRPRLAIDDLKDKAIRGVHEHEATQNAVSNVCERLMVGKRTSASELRQSVIQFSDMAAIDFDLLPLVVALQESCGDYLYDHCVNVALLSMAIATHLGLDREQVTVVGLGGLLQDIGMLRVPADIRLTSEPLSVSDWDEIRRHPLHTLDMLHELRGLPQEVRYIAYQAHERCDGQGYPRGRNGRELHQFSRLIAIADVYSAITSGRPYRSAYSPYYAAKTILENGSINKFDRELVRALLDTVSLFPIGSEVCLANGENARVIRANPELHTKPVVELLTYDGYPTGEILDLSIEDTPAVVEVVESNDPSLMSDTP